MKRLFVYAFALLFIFGADAQEKKISYKFYGQVRNDLFYNSRSNEESVDGIFYMYPKDRVYDELGKDLNATANSNFYSVYSRLGADVAGPELWGAKTSAKIEADFRGTGTTLSVVRLRHAYINLAWEKNSLLIGQTWSPLYGDVAPQILNLNMGAPFQPFSRAPQVRFQRNEGKMRFTAALLWQSQYLSQGPAGKSNIYIKNSCIPEMFVGLDYKTPAWLVGAGIDMISLVPRTQANVGEKVYKVDERITSLSYEVHLKYNANKWYVAAKSTLGSNLTHVSMLGGYGVTNVDNATGEQKYTPIRNSASWINVVYGKTWRPGLFFGYMKNLGTSKDVSTLYGIGTNVDRIMSGTAELTYNLPNWKFGCEYNYTSAWYGKLNHSNGKIIDTHSVGNNRVVLTGMFMF